MEIIMECCCGLDVHRDVVEACIIKGALDTPDKIQEQFKTTRHERDKGTVLLSRSDIPFDRLFRNSG